MSKPTGPWIRASASSVKPSARSASRRAACPRRLPNRPTNEAAEFRAQRKAGYVQLRIVREYDDRARSERTRPADIVGPFPYHPRRRRARARGSRKTAAGRARPRGNSSGAKRSDLRRKRRRPDEDERFARRNPSPSRLPPGRRARSRSKTARHVRRPRWRRRRRERCRPAPGDDLHHRTARASADQVVVDGEIDVERPRTPVSRRQQARLDDLRLVAAGADISHDAPAAVHRDGRTERSRRGPTQLHDANVASANERPSLEPFCGGREDLTHRTTVHGATYVDRAYSTLACIRRPRSSKYRMGAGRAARYARAHDDEGYRHTHRTRAEMRGSERDAQGKLL